MTKCVAWDSEKRLSFAVPFREMKPVIYLDVFLPRVTELALSASDRQTKVFVLSFIVFIVYCFKNMCVLVKKQILYFSNSSVVTFQIFQKWLSLINESNNNLAKLLYTKSSL